MGYVTITKKEKKDGDFWYIDELVKHYNRNGALIEDENGNINLVFSDGSVINHSIEKKELKKVSKPIKFEQMQKDEQDRFLELEQLYKSRQEYLDAVKSHKDKIKTCKDFMAEAIHKIFNKSHCLTVKAKANYYFTFSPRVLKAGIHYNEKYFYAHDEPMVDIILENATEMRGCIEDKRGYKFALFDGLVGSLANLKGCNEKVLETGSFTFKDVLDLEAVPKVLVPAPEGYRTIGNQTVNLTRDAINLNLVFSRKWHWNENKQEENKKLYPDDEKVVKSVLDVNEVIRAYAAAIDLLKAKESDITDFKMEFGPEMLEKEI